MITLTPHFQRDTGMEIALESVRTAQRNVAHKGYAETPHALAEHHSYHAHRGHTHGAVACPTIHTVDE